MFVRSQNELMLVKAVTCDYSFKADEEERRATNVIPVQVRWNTKKEDEVESNLEQKEKYRRTRLTFE